MDMENMVSSRPSIDWPLSIKLANNNRDLARDLLEMFINDLPRASGAIHQAFDGENHSELLSHVHKLHGASCYCGVSKLKEILAKMEFNAKEKQLQIFENYLGQFDEEVNNILSDYKLSDFV